jgi:hypothetical protein
VTTTSALNPFRIKPRKKGISGLLPIPTVHQTTSPSPTIPLMSVPPPDPIALGSPAGSTPRKRTSKACENCRLRRVKCTGDIPCRACLESSITESCHVRVKARPKRYVFGYSSSESRLLSARVKKDTPEGSQGRFEDSLAFLDHVMPLELNRAGPSRRIPTHPLSQLEEDLAIWCNQHGQSTRHIMQSFADWQISPYNPCYSRMNPA